MSNPTAEKRVSLAGEFFKALYFLPAILMAVWIGYPILVVRLAWDWSSRMMKEFTDE